MEALWKKDSRSGCRWKQELEARALPSRLGSSRWLTLQSLQDEAQGSRYDRNDSSSSDSGRRERLHAPKAGAIGLRSLQMARTEAQLKRRKLHRLRRQRLLVQSCTTRLNAFHEELNRAEMRLRNTIFSEEEDAADVVGMAAAEAGTKRLQEVLTSLAGNSQERERYQQALSALRQRHIELSMKCFKLQKAARMQAAGAASLLASMDTGMCRSLMLCSLRETLQKWEQDHSESATPRETPITSPSFSTSRERSRGRIGVLANTVSQRITRLREKANDFGESTRNGSTEQEGQIHQLLAEVRSALLALEFFDDGEGLRRIRVDNSNAREDVEVPSFRSPSAGEARYFSSRVLEFYAKREKRSSTPWNEKVSSLEREISALSRRLSAPSSSVAVCESRLQHLQAKKKQLEEFSEKFDM